MLLAEIQRSIDILEALVGFDMTSRNSNLPLIAWIESYLDRLGIAHERIPDATGTKTNVWATIGPAATPGYILSGHTDVVPTDGQSWSSDPFRLTENAAQARIAELLLGDRNAGMSEVGELVLAA